MSQIIAIFSPITNNYQQKKKHIEPFVCCLLLKLTPLLHLPRVSKGTKTRRFLFLRSLLTSWVQVESIFYGVGPRRSEALYLQCFKHLFKIHLLRL